MEKTEKNIVPRSETILLLILAAIQFINVLDFVIIMPLGPQFMRVFDISPKQFGLIVSSYTFSAAVFGFIGAFFVDRYDRKSVLLTLLAGFTLGSLFCSLAPTYQLLVAARVISGAFGGVMAATIFAIIGDQIPEIRRGSAMGTVMSGFAVASVIAIPLGLYLANISDWHAPFSLLVFISLIILIAGYKNLSPMRGHLSEIKKDPVQEVKLILTEPNHLNAFAFTIMITMAGFSVIPYLSPYMVSNVGLTEKDLPLIYLCGGFFTLFSAVGVGKLADRFGKLRIFMIMAFISTIPVFIVTNLPRIPLAFVLAITTFFMVSITSRIIPAMALVTGSVESKYRGGFMSINSSIQQLASAFAAYGAGLIVGKNDAGQIINYNIVGYAGIIATFICIFLATRLNYQDEKTIEQKVEAGSAK
jgi:predicted MFS family arabinose efflux permease